MDNKSISEAMFAGSDPMYAGIKKQIKETGGTTKVLFGLSRAMGCDAAVLFLELLEAGKYFEDRGMLREGGYFYRTYSTEEERTGLKRSKQEKAFDVLEKNGLVSVAIVRDSTFGAKLRYVRLDYARYVEFQRTVTNQTAEEAGEPYPTSKINVGLRRKSTEAYVENQRRPTSKINVKSNSIKSNNIKSLSEREGAEKNEEPTKPTVEEIEAYRQERIERGEKMPDSVTAEKFYNYYEAVGWKTTRGRSMMRTWRASFDSWAMREYEPAAAPAAQTVTGEQGSFDTGEFFDAAVNREIQAYSDPSDGELMTDDEERQKAEELRREYERGRDDDIRTIQETISEKRRGDGI